MALVAGVLRIEEKTVELPFRLRVAGGKLHWSYSCCPLCFPRLLISELI